MQQQTEIQPDAAFLVTLSWSQSEWCTLISVSTEIPLCYLGNQNYLQLDNPCSVLLPEADRNSSCCSRKYV